MVRHVAALRGDASPKIIPINDSGINVKLIFKNVVSYAKKREKTTTTAKSARRWLMW
jgi:hypothetical protein